MTENETINRVTKLFAGIEGGASFSQGILLDQNGKVLSIVKDAPSTNFWLIGLDETYKLINDIVVELKDKAKISESIVIDALGCCLSGVKDTEIEQPFAKGLLSKYPKLAKTCISRNDTIGSIFTISKEGGLVLIAGTGSNGFLLNSDGTFKNCGGWGHILGDQGSSFKLVQRAIKTVINEEDGLKKCNYNIENVKRLLLEHYQINKMIDILKYAYQNFKKDEFASACKKIAELANDQKDELAKHLFYLNGRDLARHVNALLPFIEQKLLNQKNGLRILCTGSLFKSWSLLEEGFLDCLNKDKLNEFNLVRLNCSSSIGSAFLAAKSVGHALDIQTDQNVVQFYAFKCKS